jgi:hypothetical protein
MNTKTETQIEFEFMKPTQDTFNLTDYVYPSYSVSTDSNALKVYQPTCPSIIFRNNNKNVGKLDWSDGTMKFEGDADESAQLFFDNIVKRYIQTRLPFDGWKS